MHNISKISLALAITLSASTYGQARTPAPTTPARATRLISTRHTKPDPLGRGGSARWIRNDAKSDESESRTAGTFSH